MNRKNDLTGLIAAWVASTFPPDSVETDAGARPYK